MPTPVSQFPCFIVRNLLSFELLSCMCPFRYHCVQVFPFSSVFVSLWCVLLGSGFTLFGALSASSTSGQFLPNVRFSASVSSGISSARLAFLLLCKSCSPVVENVVDGVSVVRDMPSSQLGGPPVLCQCWGSHPGGGGPPGRARCRQRIQNSQMPHLFHVKGDITTHVLGRKCASRYKGWYQVSRNV